MMLRNSICAALRVYCAEKSYGMAVKSIVEFPFFQITSSLLPPAESLPAEHKSLHLAILPFSMYTSLLPCTVKLEFVDIISHRQHPNIAGRCTSGDMTIDKTDIATSGMTRRKSSRRRIRIPAVRCNTITGSGMRYSKSRIRNQRRSRRMFHCRPEIPDSRRGRSISSTITHEF